MLVGAAARGAEADGGLGAGGRAEVGDRVVDELEDVFDMTSFKGGEMEIAA